MFGGRADYGAGIGMDRRPCTCEGAACRGCAGQVAAPGLTRRALVDESHSSPASAKDTILLAADNEVIEDTGVHYGECGLQVLGDPLVGLRRFWRSPRDGCGRYVPLIVLCRRHAWV